MMRNKVLLWVVVLSIALMGIGACAMPIHFEQGSLAADAVVIESAEQLLSGEEQAGEPIDIQDFQLLSWTDNGMLIFADGTRQEVDSNIRVIRKQAARCEAYLDLLQAEGQYDTDAGRVMELLQKNRDTQGK